MTLLIEWFPALINAFQNEKLPNYCSANVLVSLVAFEFFTYTKCGLILQICVSINNKYSAEQDTEYL